MQARSGSRPPNSAASAQTEFQTDTPADQDRGIVRRNAVIDRALQDGREALFQLVRLIARQAAREVANSPSDLETNSSAEGIDVS
jgi:hypothetical protein